MRGAVDFTGLAAPGPIAHSMTTPRFGLLYHFTHLDNLPAVLEVGELLADTDMEQRGTLTCEAGHPSIKERRRHKDVTCPPGGVVGDYVPFYFAARSPMMLTIKNGNVPTFTGDHRELVYLVSDVEHAVATGIACVVTDRNAASSLAAYSNDLAVLGDLASANPVTDFVDWSVMNLTYWGRTAEYPDRMERRMAEFLVHRSFPLGALIETASQNEAVRDKVQLLFEAHGRDIPHRVRPEWYYT